MAEGRRCPASAHRHNRHAAAGHRGFQKPLNRDLSLPDWGAQDGEYKTGKNGSGPGNGNGGSNNSSNGAGSQGQPAAQSQPTQMADVQQQAIGDVESFSLVVGPSGEVTHCASGGLRNVKNYPHFNQACK